MVTKDSMVTLGVDLASQPKKTGVCLIRWDGGSAKVTMLKVGATDSRLQELFAETDKIDKIGIDAPFGWPSRFTTALAAYAQTKQWPPEGDAVSERGSRPLLSDLFPTSRFPYLRYRRTDENVKRYTKQAPLSVSSDKIAVLAMRAARLLSEASKNETVDRSGKCGRFVEVYPAAALRAWDLFPSSSYKSGAKARNNREKITEALAGCVEYNGHLAQCQASDDALDALVAALVTRAHALGLCHPIPEEDQEQTVQKLAEEEGWIALPKEGSLANLLNSPSAPP